MMDGVIILVWYEIEYKNMEIVEKESEKKGATTTTCRKLRV